MITFDSSLLTAFYQNRAGIGAAAGSSTGLNSLLTKKAPTPPWSSLSTAAEPSELMKGVLRGRDFINESAAKLDVKGASDDYRKLFAMHQGLETLEALAKRMQDEKITDVDKKSVQAAFERGLAEISGYIDGADFEKLRMTHGQAADKAKATVGVPKTQPTYLTGQVHAGTANDEVAAFQGDMKFELKVDHINKTVSTVTFDLSEMGSTPRSMTNVVTYMNNKLAAEGLYTRVAMQRTEGVASETVIGTKTIKGPKAPDTFALKIQGDTTEKLTFSAAQTAPAVYVTQTAGNPDPDEDKKTDDAKQTQEFLKLETGSVADAQRKSGDKNWVEGRVFSKTLPENVANVRQTVTGADGFVYMLADVKGEVDGQTIKGAQDVALMKYDSSGNLVYSRTLGASDTASGLSLSIADDGRVAVAGSVKGGLVIPVAGASTSKTASATTIQDVDGADAAKTDSFVTLFDKEGQEVWTHRSGAREDDEATGVAFGDNGAVYVVGRSKSAMPGSSAVGGWDNYLQSFDATGKLKSTNQFGTTGDDKPAGLVVTSRGVTVASVEGGKALLRTFDVATNPAKPTVSATRDLGTIGGGSISGIALDGDAIVIAGSARGSLSVGQTTSAYSGGMDAFAARVHVSLGDNWDASTPASERDSIAYYGGAGDDYVTAMDVTDGKVWVTGTTKKDLPGMADAAGEIQDGFVAGIDLSTGKTAYSQRFTAQDGFAAPTSISVDASGSSVLDRLGLPKGQIAYADSQLVTSATAARAGDQFQIRTRSGARPVTVTIDAKDTLETLATKVRKATSYMVTVDVVSGVDSRYLQIKPLNDRYSVEILGGTGGRDALEALGLQEGFVRKTVTDKKTEKLVPADGGAPMYGLKLPRDLNLNSEDAIKATLSRLTESMSILRGAYRDMEAAMNPQANANKPKGEAPAYLKNQIANYQAGLDRLMGGG